MATHKLALILKNSLNDDHFLLVKQSRPPKFDHEEYDSYVDSDLWDLPSAHLNPLQGESESQAAVEVADSHLEDINLKEFDISSALNEVFDELGFGAVSRGEWKFFKYVKEAAFGPGLPIHTLFITGTLAAEDKDLPDTCRWMSVQSCLNWLLEVKPCGDRVGPLAVVSLISDSPAKWKVPPTINYQEFPPGVIIIPMGSRTVKPFRTTNLVVFAPEQVPSDFGDKNLIACGDALIVDPGCLSEFHEELQKIVTALPKRLVVFVTHHHPDHVDGLSVIQRCNPDATLLAHENTMRRIKRDDWSLGYTSVSGGEDIYIGDQRLRVIFAPGHTDGHMALHHVNTHSLIVGDHCVGHGSAVLDINSGGNMAEYFQTTYNFLELSPHSLIPMHGRVNLWPKQMLCGYLKNRRSREASILAAIEGGARTLFDIVANVYSDVDRRAWIPASWNVRLHVDYLAQQDKLPKDFSLETYNSSLVAFVDTDFSVQKFQNTCKLQFLSQWTLAYITGGFHLRKHPFRVAMAVSVAMAGFAVFYSVIKQAQ
ncbi:metallo-beta-lactamase superfamily protein [Senna tora]|uniref:Metallo-beta-lactamase superfamily protein n=1 Tax=Senna tora TaxID=362788 RepID=A0A834SW07_9FABA|nr:metallo-beta-lactamase superfamily protein [Senna tora]